MLFLSARELFVLEDANQSPMSSRTSLSLARCKLCTCNLSMHTLALVQERYTLYQPLFRISPPHSRPNNLPAPQARADTPVVGYVTPAPLQPRMSPGALKISWGRTNHPSLPSLRPCLSPLIARPLRSVKYTLAGLICQGARNTSLHLSLR